MAGSTTILFPVTVLLVLLVYECHVVSGKVTSTQIDKSADYHISFDEQKIKCNVSKEFISIALSIGDLNKTNSAYDFTSRRLRRFLRALSPAVVRIGGSKANFVVFEDDSVDVEDAPPASPVEPSAADNTKHLESRAYVPIPSADDIRRLERHTQHKRFAFDDLPGFNLIAKNKKSMVKLKKKPHKRVFPPPEAGIGVKPPKQVGKPGDTKLPPDASAKPPPDVAKPPPDSEDSPPPDPDKPIDGPPPAPPGKEPQLPPALRKKLRKEQKKKKLKGFKEFKMTTEQFDNLYRLVNRTGNTMLFDVNAFPRAFGSRSWNSSNALSLMTYAETKGYVVDWQLGNEPNHYKKFGKEREQSGSEVGNDYVQFRKLVKWKQPDGRVVGPDITRPKAKGKVGKWLGDFLKVAANEIDALSWHQYYMDGKEANEEDFIDPANLDKFVIQNQLMKKILAENKFTKPVWITETGSAWGGGAKDLSNRFAGVFPYVDKLGVAGDNCVQVVARQSFLSGRYAMVDKTTYNPHPEFYAGALFKRLAAMEVLTVNVDKPDAKFRVYARCAKESKHTLPGSVMLIAVNLDKTAKSFAFFDYELFKVKQYLLTADSLTSDTVKLNNEPLIMDGDNLPRMRPVYVEQPISVPPQGVGYYVLDSINLQIC